MAPGLHAQNKASQKTAAEPVATQLKSRPFASGSDREQQTPDSTAQTNTASSVSHNLSNISVLPPASASTQTIQLMPFVKAQPDILKRQSSAPIGDHRVPVPTAAISDHIDEQVNVQLPQPQTPAAVTADSQRPQRSLKEKMKGGIKAATAPFDVQEITRLREPATTPTDERPTSTAKKVAKLGARVLTYPIKAPVDAASLAVNAQIPLAANKLSGGRIPQTKGAEALDRLRVQRQNEKNILKNEPDSAQAQQLRELKKGPMKDLNTFSVLNPVNRKWWG